MRVGLVVERGYFAEPVAPVEGLRFGQGLVGREPHPLDLAIGRMTLQGAAPDGLFVQGSQHEVALRRRELCRRGRYAARRIEAGFEPGRELREIAFETVPGGRTVGILYRQADGAACKIGQASVLFRWSDKRRLTATRVKVGFAAPPVGYTDAPAT